MKSKNKNKSNHNNTNHLKAMLYSNAFSYGLVFLWMAIIFFLSHQEGSQSSSFSFEVANTLAKAWTFVTGLEISNLLPITFMLRKSSHFIAYLILGVLIFRSTPTPSINHGLVSFGLSILYAGSDEFHQTFILGRSGEVRDVFIDGLGALTGIALYYIYCQFKKIRQE